MRHLSFFAFEKILRNGRPSAKSKLATTPSTRPTSVDARLALRASSSLVSRDMSGASFASLTPISARASAPATSTLRARARVPLARIQRATVSSASEPAVADASAATASSSTPRWREAWSSVANPSTRVAYVDDAERDRLRDHLDACGLRDALAAVDGEIHVRGAVAASGPPAATLADVAALDLAGALLGPAGDSPNLRRAVRALECDVAAVVRSFGACADQPVAVVAVSLLRRTLCSKLHVDHVPLRVMVTYLGAGTEILSEPASLAISLAAKRGGDALGDLAKTFVGESARAAGASRHAEECEVVLLKGERWPGNEGRAIVHRSPVVDECCGEWRLCLRVDAPEHVNPIESMGDGR